MQTATETERFDIYKNVHKGLRRELAELVVDAGRLEPADRRAIEQTGARWRFVKALLDAHHHHEDEHLGPHLARLVPALFDVLSQEHETLHAETERLVELSRTMADTGACHRFYLDLVSFVSRYFQHMEKEERAAMSALQAAYDDAELAAIDGAIVASISPELTAAFFTRMLSAMNGKETYELLRDARAHTPPPVFEGLWTLARATLDAPAFRRLEARLGEAA